MTRPKKPKAPRRTVEPESGKKHSDLLPQDRQAKLGAKHVCFNCTQRFYDMNKPEPICPKCGSDQRKRPKNTDAAPPSPPAAKREKPRPMPLLDDDETEAVPFEGEEMDLDIEGLETGEELFEEGEGDAAEGPEDDVEEP